MDKTPVKEMNYNDPAIIEMVFQALLKNYKAGKIPEHQRKEAEQIIRLYKRDNSAEVELSYSGE